ncbi:AAA family ATPase [Paenibacillus sp. FSL H8-0332]|uniref:AAA family ATPase n=1 Tax=Paenibacillus sp. FSL H8-0332 TaxID=2954742 RepID=UPI0030CF54A1
MNYENAGDVVPEKERMMELKLPLFIITGASGVGKTTVMHELRKQLPEFVLFSTDDDHFGTTGKKLEYQDRYNLLLHAAQAIALSGRGTVICGTMMPWDAKKCDAYSTFSELHFMNLHCDDATRNSRLRSREDAATWTEDMLRQHEVFAQWLLDHAETDYEPPMPTFDSASTPPAQLAEQLKEYITLKWQESVGK